MKICTINIEDFLDTMISTLNEHSEATSRTFSYNFKQEVRKTNTENGVKVTYVKQLILYTSDINTGLRVEVVKKELVLKNSNEALKYNWKKDLLLKLYGDCISFYLINQGDRELILKQQATEELKTIST